jgi:L-ascorbate metabolism protein UlaG (beta-lactamase superfamily)
VSAGPAPHAAPEPAARRPVRQRLWRVSLATVALLAALVLVPGWYFSGPGHRGPRSDHFDGRRFHNPTPTGHQEPAQVLRWLLTRAPRPFPERPLASPAAPPPARVDGAALRVQLVNHSTVLLQGAGWNLLTDPIWSERSSPVSFAGPRRRSPPGIPFEQLPPIDLVLLSHDHYDHLDLPTVERLAAAHDPLFVVPLGNGALLRGAGARRVVELDWGESTYLGPLTVHCVPVQHFAGRGLFDRDARLWCGYVIDLPGGRIYFGGDTGFGPHFERTAAQFAPFRLALLPIGAYLPRWFMGPVHLEPAEAVRASAVLRAEVVVPIHFGTFPLADDGRDDPLEDLGRALEGDEGQARFEVLENGQVLELRAPTGDLPPPVPSRR